MGVCQRSQRPCPQARAEEGVLHREVDPEGLADGAASPPPGAWSLGPRQGTKMANYCPSLNPLATGAVGTWSPVSGWPG